MRSAQVRVRRRPLGRDRVRSRHSRLGRLSSRRPRRYSGTPPHELVRLSPIRAADPACLSPPVRAARPALTNTSERAAGAKACVHSDGVVRVADRLTCGIIWTGRGSPEHRTDAARREREARQARASRASGRVCLKCQQPVAGWRNPGNGLRSPMRVYRPTLVEALWVGSEMVFGDVRINQGRNASSSGW